MRGLNIHTHTHKRNRLLGFFFFFLYILDILNLKIFFFVLIFECRWVGNVYSYLCRFLPFPSFFFFVSFVFFFLLFFSRCSQGPYCIFFSFVLLRPLASRLLHPSIHSYFFHQVFLHPGQRRHCETLPPHPPPILSQSSNHFTS